MLMLLTQKYMERARMVAEETAASANIAAKLHAAAQAAEEEAAL